MIGTESGEIAVVSASDLTTKHLTSVPGRIVWLANQNRRIVAVVDNSPEVLPWPGEQFEDFEKRSSRIEKATHLQHFVAIYNGGPVRRIPFDSKGFATPSVFAIDNKDHLWMGADKGEWGGEFSRMDLQSGKVKTVQTAEGVIGFLPMSGSSPLVYGGMSHMGMRGGFIGQLESSKLHISRQFKSSDWQTPVPEPAQRFLDANSKNLDRTVDPNELPRGPVDLMLTDRASGGFWVVSEHTLFHASHDLSTWNKITKLGGRWFGGRNYSVGNTPTVNKVLVEGDSPNGLLVVMGRDGFARVADGQVQHVPFQGELESPVIDFWETTRGMLFLSEDSDHTGWQMDDGRWKSISLFPRATPVDSSADWNFAEPAGNDRTNVYAFDGDNTMPGRRVIVNVSDTNVIEPLLSWNDSSSEFSASLLLSSDGTLLREADGKLWRQKGSEWAEAGTSGPELDAERRQVLRGRRYIYLSSVEHREYFLDAAVGDLKELSKDAVGSYHFQPARVQNKAVPGAIFDAVADGSETLLMATAKGLLRFHLQTGVSDAIASPSRNEEFKSLSRDADARLWAAGDRVYISSDEGKQWTEVKLPMVSTTYIKRIRPNPDDSRGMILSLHDRGLVLLRW